MRRLRSEQNIQPEPHYFYGLAQLTALYLGISVGGLNRGIG